MRGWRDLSKSSNSHSLAASNCDISFKVLVPHVFLRRAVSVLCVAADTSQKCGAMPSYGFQRSSLSLPSPSTVFRIAGRTGTYRIENQTPWLQVCSSQHRRTLQSVIWVTAIFRLQSRPSGATGFDQRFCGDHRDDSDRK